VVIWLSCFYIYILEHGTQFVGFMGDVERDLSFVYSFIYPVICLATGP